MGSDLLPAISRAVTLATRLRVISERGRDAEFKGIVADLLLELAEAQMKLDMNLTGGRTTPTPGCFPLEKRLPQALEEPGSARGAGEAGFTAARKPLGLDHCLIAKAGLRSPSQFEGGDSSLKVRTAAQLCAPASPSDQDVSYRSDGGSDNGNSGNRTLDQRLYAVEASSIERYGLRARVRAGEPDQRGRCGAVI
jgi:hypothetical protein